MEDNFIINTKAHNSYLFDFSNLSSHFKIINRFSVNDNELVGSHKCSVRTLSPHLPRYQDLFNTTSATDLTINP